MPWRRVLSCSPASRRSHQAQSGGVGFNAIPQFPPLIVGDMDEPVSLRLENRSTVEYANDEFNVTEITLVPNCGSKASSESCEAGARDPGVLTPSETASVATRPRPRWAATAVPVVRSRSRC